MRDRRHPQEFHGYREQSRPRYRVPRTGGGFVGGCFGLLLVVVIFVIAGLAFIGVLGLAHRTTETCTVNDKSVGYDKDGHGIYRIYTNECGVLGIKDVPFVGNFNSADLYSHIQRGRTFRFTTVGFRNGFFSWFPTIIEVHAA